MATTSVCHRVYVRSLGNGPVLRTMAHLTGLTFSHDISGPSRIEMRLIATGPDTRPTGDHPDLPLTERLALAVLDGDDTAIYPLIDEFLLTRNR